MCSIPPPPPLIALNTLNNNVTCRKSNSILNIDSHLCSWAANYPDLQQACINNGICLLSTPHQYQYQTFKTIIQEGPTCGLVALTMMLKEDLKVNEVLEIARKKGYTNNGEMFSCKDMMNLIIIMSSICNTNNLKIELRKGELCSNFIINKLLNKCLLLVPYPFYDFNIVYKNIFILKFNRLLMAYLLEDK